MNRDEVLARLRYESTNVFANSDVMQPYLFVETLKCHDWRNHVPESIQDVWDDLTELERRLVMLSCEPAADRENWD